MAEQKRAPIVTPESFDPRAALAAQLDRQEREREQHARELAEARADAADAKREATEANIKAVCYQRGTAAGLDASGVNKLADDMAAMFRDRTRQGQPFDVYRELQVWLHAAGRIALPPGDGANPIDDELARLPPPPQPGKPGAPLTGSEEAERAARAEAAQARAKALAKQVAADREAYHAALRRHGLTPPGRGYPGGGGGAGFGM